MINGDFYPTPKALIEQMLRGIKDLDSLLILEPSAGKGDIVDFIKETLEDRSPYRRNISCSNVHCVESDLDLRATLSGKGYKIVGDDFLSYNGSGLFYDLIVMNPPFSNGVAHVLHAWNLLKQGDLIAILPKEVFNNPYCESRKLLAKVIQDNSGTIEDAGQAFIEAERKTHVEVVIIRLQKKHSSELDDIFEGASFESSTIDNIEPSLDGNQLVRSDVVEALVDAYSATLSSFKDAFRGIMQLSFYGSCFGNNMGETDYNGHKLHKTVIESFCDSMSRYSFNQENIKESYKCVFNSFSEELRTAAWETVFDKTNMKKFMTKGVKNEFEKLQKDQGSVEFSKENVDKLLAMLFYNSGKIGESSVIEAFDLMTKYHAENRIHIEGWKTNDVWRVNKKFILPMVMDFSFRVPHVHYSRSNELDDIDRGLCFIEGKSFDSIVKCSKALHEAGLNQCRSCQSEFFDIKFYKKGTAHFIFRSEDTWEKFNITACKGKKWLPEGE